MATELPVHGFEREIELPRGATRGTSESSIATRPHAFTPSRPPAAAMARRGRRPRAGVSRPRTPGRRCRRRTQREERHADDHDRDGDGDARAARRDEREESHDADPGEDAEDRRAREEEAAQRRVAEPPRSSRRRARARPSLPPPGRRARGRAGAPRRSRQPTPRPRRTGSPPHPRGAASRRVGARRRRSHAPRRRRATGSPIPTSRRRTTARGRAAQHRDDEPALRRIAAPEPHARTARGTATPRVGRAPARSPSTSAVRVLAGEVAIDGPHGQRRGDRRAVALEHEPHVARSRVGRQHAASRPRRPRPTDRRSRAASR